MGTTYRIGVLAVFCPILFLGAVHGQDVQVLCDFEDPAQLKLWEIGSGTPRLVSEEPLHGKQSLEITFDPKARYRGAYLNSFRLPKDWSAYDALIVDVLNPSQEPMDASLLVADRAWEESGGSYWNRHNSGRSFPLGRTEWVIPLRGLYRGEAGSRNNDIKRNIDPDSIVRIDFGFGGRGKAGRVVIDHLRLVKTATTENVWAFDFGPKDQAETLGWTPVSDGTQYNAERGYGWGPQGGTPWEGAARDTTFGCSLLQDFCEGGGYRFRVDVPPDRYRATVWFENSGYWGGEQAKHRRRSIAHEGKVVWSETRPDGPVHALYRFEEVEPIGVDLWDAYMAEELARPATFDVDVSGEGLQLEFQADVAWGSKIAALAVHRAEDAEAAKWLAEQIQKIAAEFRGKALCLDPSAADYQPSPAWQSTGLVAWPVDIEDDVAPHTTPTRSVSEETTSTRSASEDSSHAISDPQDLQLSRLALRGEFEPFCLAIRPLHDLGLCSLQFDPFQGPGSITATTSVVWYNTSRDFGQIAYHVRPHTLREQTTVDLRKDLTREVVVTALVRSSAPAGEYRGALRIVDPKGELLLRSPLKLTVSSAVLDRQTDFLMGFFGLKPPDLVPAEERERILDETLRLLRSHGMNAVSGGPSLRLAGWNDGRPQIDFGEMDRFMERLKEHGFTRAINGYGGMRLAGLHDGYVQGATGRKVEEQSGLPYPEALKRAWQAVDVHARQAGWPLIYYAMCDETRVRQVAEEELKFMKLMADVSRAFPETLRTSGSYSVSFDRRPDDPEDMLTWHQRFFEALDVSSLNNHDPTVMAEAEKLSKEIHIYNQGRTRYSFGLYQWSEYQKGVRARWQWHLNVLHGYQFFDLDGREPDTAMICYGRNRIYPTIHFERCREGAEDFYLLQTLARRIETLRAGGADSAELRAAEKLLESTTASVALNQRQPPEGYDADGMKRALVEALEGLQ